MDCGSETAERESVDEDWSVIDENASVCSGVGGCGADGDDADIVTIHREAEITRLQQPNTTSHVDDGTSMCDVADLLATNAALRREVDALRLRERAAAAARPFEAKLTIEHAGNAAAGRVALEAARAEIARWRGRADDACQRSATASLCTRAAEAETRGARAERDAARARVEEAEAESAGAKHREAIERSGARALRDELAAARAEIRALRASRDAAAAALSDL
jgi:hypothetical protein